MSSSLLLRSLGGVLVATIVTSCVPNLPNGGAREPNVEVPETYGGETSIRNSARISWREFFQDPCLIALIDEALHNNQELNIAVQDLLVTRSEVVARTGEILPRMGIALGAGIERVGEHSSQGRSDEQAELPADLQDYSLGVYASWEVDVWRRLRNLRDAAMHRYLASAQGRNFMVTRLIAEIATEYYNLLRFDAELSLIQRSISYQERALEMARIQQEAAHATRLAVMRFEAQLRGFQSREFEVRQEVVEIENRLNFLMGRFPQPIERDASDFLIRQPEEVWIGAPTQLLENRPDVQQAELGLSAAQLDVAAARARFYPSLRIEGEAGLGSFDIRKLISPGSLIYNLFAGLTAPLFNRRGIRADYVGADAREMQAVLTYERTVLNAYIEVRTSLSRVHNSQRVFDFRSQQASRLNDSVEISNELFRNARANYLEVLTTQSEALEAQRELLDARRRQFDSTVQLYRALGGGWRDVADTNTEAGLNTANATPPNIRSEPTETEHSTASEGDVR